MTRNLEQEAEALARRFEGRNRALFARETKFPGGQAMIYQNITGRKPISLDGAIAYAKGFGCSISDISDHWAQVISTLPVFDSRPAFNATEPPNHYGNITPMESRRKTMSPLQTVLMGITQNMDETGLAILIGCAQAIALQHPVKAARNLQN